MGRKRWRLRLLGHRGLRLKGQNMNDQELRFAKAMECFRDIVAMLELAAREGWHMDQLERSVKPRLAEMGKEFLFAFAQATFSIEHTEAIRCRIN